MKIAVAQLACRQNEPNDNFRRIAEWIGRAAAGRAELVVFPEMFNTGCAAAAIETGAIHADGPEAAELSRLSAQHKIAIVAGLAEKAPAENGQEAVYNSAFLFTPAGEIKVYRKIHL